MKRKDLNDGEIRVISIGYEALEELVFEHLIDNAESLFGLSDITEAFIDMYWDYDAKVLTCAAHNNYPLFRKGVDFKKVVEETGFTTESLYCPPCYKTIVATQRDGRIEAYERSEDAAYISRRGGVTLDMSLMDISDDDLSD